MAETVIADMLSTFNESTNQSQSTTESHVDQPPSGLITAEQVKIVDMFVVVSALLICGAGIVTNALNIGIFAKLGLMDGVTLTLFHLALSDFAMCISSGICIAAFACQQVEIWSTMKYAVDPNIVTIYFSNFGEMFYLSTTLTTTLIAVVRCFLVAKPLQFKNTFTISRTAWALIWVDIFTLANFLPILISFQTILRFEPAMNKSRPVMYLSGARDIAQDVKSALVDIAVSVVTQVVVVACLIVMVIKLREASKFRQATAQVQETPDSKMSTANYQVLVQIVLVSTLYVICNTPKIVIAFTRLAMPSFDAGRQYHALYIISYEFRLIIEALSSATNFAIYYKFNTRFRDIITCRSKSDQNSGSQVWSTFRNSSSAQ